MEASRSAALSALTRARLARPTDRQGIKARPTVRMERPQVRRMRLPKRAVVGCSPEFARCLVCSRTLTTKRPRNTLLWRGRWQPKPAGRDTVCRRSSEAPCRSSLGMLC